MCSRGGLFPLFVRASHPGVICKESAMPRVSDVDPKTQRGVCDTHGGVKLYWNKRTDCTKGGSWRCAKCSYERVRRTRKQDHGLTLDEAQSLREHVGRCEICLHTPENVNSKSGLKVDHCHRTGTLRGVLCTRCNNKVMADLDLLVGPTGLHQELIPNLYVRHTEGVVQAAVAYWERAHAPIIPDR